MPKYVMLSTLTPKGTQTLQANPDRLKEVNRDVGELGATVLHQWAMIGAYDFLNVMGMPPWALLTVPVIDVPSAESSPANVHGCVFGNSKLRRRSFIVKSRSALLMVCGVLPPNVFRSVTTSLPCTVPSAFFVNSRKMW